jgi:hypothetical protein
MPVRPHILPSNNIAIPIFSHYDCPYLSSQGKNYVRTVSSHTICMSPQKKQDSNIDMCLDPDRYIVAVCG